MKTLLILSDPSTYDSIRGTWKCELIERRMTVGWIEHHVLDNKVVQ